MGRGSASIAAFVAALFAATPARPGQPEPPAAAQRWTISNSGCIGVGLHEESWLQCGFRDFAMNADGTLVLTVSNGDTIQLWDGDGRELLKLDRSDPRASPGASGGPVLIAGGLGIAVTHRNQLTVIDLADGRVLSRTVPDVVELDELRPAGDRLYVLLLDSNMRRRIREVVLPTGTLREVPGADHRIRLDEVAVPAWVAGMRAPFTIHASRPGGAEHGAVRPCTPMAGRFCLWRDLPGRFIHMVDLETGIGRSLDVGRTLGSSDSVQFAAAAGQPLAMICAYAPPGQPHRLACSIRDLTRDREIHHFETEHDPRLSAGIDAQGRVEARLTLYRSPGREQWRVAADGRREMIDAEGRANLGPPGGGLILPGETDETSLLVDPAGRAVARLPFGARTCGAGPPAWMGNCRVSADGRRWLVPRFVRQPDDEMGTRLDLMMVEVPAAAD